MLRTADRAIELDDRLSRFPWQFVDMDFFINPCPALVAKRRDVSTDLTRSRFHRDTRRAFIFSIATSRAPRSLIERWSGSSSFDTQACTCSFNLWTEIPLFLWNSFRQLSQQKFFRRMFPALLFTGLGIGPEQFLQTFPRM